MSRSTKKGPFVDAKLLKKVMAQKESGKIEPIQTWARACVIVPEFINHAFAVHNGNRFIKVQIREDMVGHRLGEFAPTRTFHGHAGKKKEKAPATT